MTNREMLNSMSDEELAEEIYRKSENSCEHCNYKGQICVDNRCVEGILEWLESEVEE